MENLDKKIKICHIVSAGMTVRFILMNQLLYFKNQGYDVSVVCSDEKWVKEIQSYGVMVKTIEIKRKIFTPISDLNAFVKLVLYFRKEKIDIAHTHTPKAGILGRFAAKVAGVPAIFHTNHGFYFQDNSPFLKRKFFIFAEKLAAHCCDMMFSINKEDIESAVAEKICNRERIKYSGDGIDIARFNPAKFSEKFINDEKIKLGIKSADKIIGFVGRLVKEKGIWDLMRASETVLRKFPNTIFLVIGPSEPEKGDCFEPTLFNKSSNLDKKVLFLGVSLEIDKMYPLMDILVLPSHREGLGLVLLEASAMEKPVVATNIRGCREAVDNNKTGLLVPVKDPEELARAIIYLLSNPSAAEQMGKAGREKVLREFDEKLVFDRIKKGYERLIFQKDL